MGLILKLVSEFYHLIILKLALFILPIYCTLSIIGTTCLSGLELWKMNLFSHYFKILVLLFYLLLLGLLPRLLFYVIFVFVIAPGVVFICHVLFALAFTLTIVAAVIVATMSFVCGSVTMVCVALLRFTMVIYMYMCMCICMYMCVWSIYIYVCAYVYVHILSFSFY